MALKSEAVNESGGLYLSGNSTLPYDNKQILLWLLFLRVVVSTFVFGTVFLIEHPEVRHAFYTLIGVHVLSALLSALMIQRYANKTFFLVIQVYWDIFFVSGLVYISGGYFSFFLFMYIISVINASILLKRKAAIVSSVVCALILVFLFISQWRGDIPVPNSDFGLQPMSSRDVANKIALNVFAIFVASYLASFLSERSKVVSDALKKKQDDLARLRLRFEHIIRSIPVGVMTVNVDGIVDFANASSADILNATQGILHNRSIYDVIHGLPLDFLQKPIRPIPVQFTRDGKTSQLEISHSPLESAEGQSLGGLIVIEDRTDIRSMEEAVKRADKLAVVGKLAAGIAHELRNPLASISGSIQLLFKELKLNDVDRQLMDIVMRETERVNGLVTDFLAFSPPERNIECLVNARIILGEVLKVLANEPGCRDRIEIQKSIDDRLFVKADPKSLRQLFWNLAINAVQAMPDGGVLTITGRASPGPIEGMDGRAVEILFGDTGLGMDEDTIKSIFDPFFTTKDDGTGLGLTSSHNIVDWIGGRISVESQPGKGSRFMILLPAAKRAGLIIDADGS